MALALLKYNVRQLNPAYNPEDAIPINVNFAPNLTIAQGQLVGAISTATTNDVQTLTVTATGGHFTLSITGIDGDTYTTASLLYNIAAADLTIAVNALLETAGFHLGTVTTTGGPGSASGSAPYVMTFAGALAGIPVPLIVGATVDLTGTSTAVVVHTTTGITLGTFRDYASGHSDGSQVPVGVAPAAFKTDALGRIVYGNVPNLPPYVEVDKTIPVYVLGFFFTQDLVGLDANAITVGLGKLIKGTVAEGVIFLR
jgi:hypothetical protein